MLTTEERKLVVKIADLRDEIPKSDGKKAKSKINQFEIAFHIYSGNKEQLTKLLNKVSDINYARDLFTGKSEDSRIDVYREFVRLFHNYSISIGSLIDITRRLMQKYYDENEILDSYQSKIEELFIDNNLSTFIKDLRNYFTHYQVPDIYQQLTISIDNPNYSGYKLLRDKLLEGYNWKAESKEFLDNCEERFDIKNLILRYDEFIDEFYNWLFDLLYDYHKEELSQMESIKREIQELKSKLNFTLL